MVWIVNYTTTLEKICTIILHTISLLFYDNPFYWVGCWLLLIFWKESLVRCFCEKDRPWYNSFCGQTFLHSWQKLFIWNFLSSKLTKSGAQFLFTLIQLFFQWPSSLINEHLSSGNCNLWINQVFINIYPRRVLMDIKDLLHLC